ncbi:MAG: amidohydrolase family protein, partial [Prolixibacteraceae bacterium]|nr:amidohydrolase family protein [Prolixibacteraceae bacterium]
MNSCSRITDADLIVIDATVFLLDEDFSTVESFAVVEGKIAATGTSAEIMSRYISKNVINASGKYVYPGFNDAHCHFKGYGENLLQFADLRGTTGPEEICEIIGEHYNKFHPEWVLGRNWDQNDWENGEFPDKTVLDKLFPGVPVFLVRVDGHACWCNSKALQMAGITSDTEVSGGVVEVKNGEPTGILIDQAIALVSGHIPEISGEDQEKALLEAQKNCFAAGLTSVTDCGLDKPAVLLIEEMQNRGELKIRVNAM